METISNLATKLAQEVASKYRAESSESERIIVTGSVLVVGEINHEYDYTAEVTVRNDSYTERHPYGMGTASEEFQDSSVEDIQILKISPLDGGPEDDPAIDAAIKQDVFSKL